MGGISFLKIQSTIRSTIQLVWNLMKNIAGEDYLVLLRPLGEPANSEESYEAHDLFIPNHGTDPHAFAAQELNVPRAHIVYCNPASAFVAVRSKVIRHNASKSLFGQA